MDDTGTRTHMLDLFGNHTFDNGMNLDYSFRYQHANAGSGEFAYFAITDAFLADLEEARREVVERKHAAIAAAGIELAAK